MRSAVTRIQHAYDVLFAGYYHRLVIAVLAIVIVATASQGYALASDWEPWVVGDWLINYGGGFVRRGLGGELLIIASAYSGVPVNMLLFAALLLLNAAFCVTFAALLWDRRLTFWYVALCLSPTTLLFTIYNPEATGRKEVFVYVAFALWVYALRNRWRGGTLAALAWGSLAIVVTLIHEVFFFFVLYFACVALLASRAQADDGGAAKMSLAIVTGSLVAVVAIALLSGPLTDAALCDRLVGIGAPRDVCNGILSYPDVSIGNGLREFAGHFDPRTFVGLLLVVPVVLVPLLPFLSTNPAGSSAFVTAITLAVGCLLFSSPLFVLAVDWGRWISIHAVLLTIACALILPARDSAPTPDPLRSAPPIYLALGMVIVLALTVSWSVRYCCGPDYLVPFGPVTTIERVVQWVLAM